MKTYSKLRKQVLKNAGRIGLALLAGLLYSGVLYAQRTEINKENLPASVVKAIETDFPYWGNIKWYAYDNVAHEWANVRTARSQSGINPAYYVAVATGKNVTTRAVYSKDGKLLRSRTVLKNTPLPPAIMSTINRDYSGWMVTGDLEVIRNFDNNTKHYKVTLEQGRKKQTLYFNASGKRVRARNA